MRAARALARDVALPPSRPSATAAGCLVRFIVSFVVVRRYHYRLHRDNRAPLGYCQEATAWVLCRVPCAQYMYIYRSGAGAGNTEAVQRQCQRLFRFTVADDRGLRACTGRRIHNRRRFVPLALWCSVARLNGFRLTLTANCHRDFVQVGPSAHESGGDMNGSGIVFGFAVSNVFQVKGLGERRDADKAGAWAWGVGLTGFDAGAYGKVSG